MCSGKHIELRKQWHIVVEKGLRKACSVEEAYCEEEAYCVGNGLEFRLNFV